MPTQTRRAPRHRAETRAGIPARILATVGVLFAAIVFALVGTGTSYALWTGEATIDASTIGSGSTSMSINGSTDYLVDGLDVTELAPGLSVSAPLTIANTGTTPLSFAVVSTEVVAQTNSLADNLLIALVEDSCATAPKASSALAGFTTLAAPTVMTVGDIRQVCLVVTMKQDAPLTVQGGTATFAMTIDALQVRLP